MKEIPIENKSKHFYIENISLLFFLLCFTMPYVRVGLDGLVWAKEYQENPTGLPRIIELAVLLLLFLQILIGKITITKFLTMLNNDKIFLILFVVSFYVLLQPFFLDFFSFVISPTSKGVIRGNLIMPMIAYIVGRHYNLTEKGIRIFFAGLLLAGTLQAIAILYPAIFPDYMIYGYSEKQPLWIFQGPIGEVERRAGFWDLSTQAATFMSIIMCLSIAALFYFKAKQIKLLMFCILALSIIALSSTLQRIQFIAISFIVLYVIFKKVGTLKTNRRKQYLLKFLVFSSFIFVNILYPYIFVSRLSSIYHSFYQDYRVQVVWPSYIEFIFREPSVLLFGSGYTGDALSDIGTPLHLAHAHNQFLGWLAGIGLFMTMLFVCMFFIYYQKAKIATSSNYLNDYEKMMSYFAKLVLMTIFVICLAESPLLQEPISILVFFVGGIVTSMYKSHLFKQIHMKGASAH
ncbi:MAG: O-antigen ligase family protein [Nitrospirota bacterium]